MTLLFDQCLIAHLAVGKFQIGHDLLQTGDDAAFLSQCELEALLLFLDCGFGASQLFVKRGDLLLSP